MECMNMLKEKHYAHERRAKNREKLQKKERLQIQELISNFLSLEQLQQAQQSKGIPDPLLSHKYHKKSLN